MAEYPDNIYSPRTIENLPGIVYDETKETHFFAEDLNNTNAEIVAIEEILGTDPQGAFPTVKDWLTSLSEANFVPYTGANTDINIGGFHIVSHQGFFLSDDGLNGLSGINPGLTLITHDTGGGSDISIEPGIDLTPGTIVSVDLATAGEDYAVNDVITISGGDDNAQVNIDSVSPGRVIGVVPNNPGSGYNVGDRPFISAGNGDCDIQVDAVDGLGGITSLSIIDFGSGYDANATDVPITGGAGSGATVDITVLKIGAILAWSIVSGGSNYVSASGVATHYGGSGSGFSVNTIVNPDEDGVVKIKDGHSGFFAKLKTADITSDQEYSFPDQSGTLALTSDITGDFSTDVEVENIGDGFILKSPDGTRWRITIDNSGALITTAI